MATVLSSLTKYVDEQRLPLISKLGVATKTASEFELMTGVKNESALNLLSANAIFQDGHSCGWNASGSNTFTQRTIKVGSVKVEDSICQNAMQEYWMNYQVQVGANRKNLPFEEEIANKYVDSVNEKVEKLLWQGDVTTNGDAFDGLATILDASSGVIVATAATSATAYDRVKAVYNAIPDAVLGKAVIYMNYAEFRSLVQELVSKNLYNYVTNQDSAMEIILPGTDTHVKAMAGLNGLDAIFALVPEHTFYGCDLAGDKEDFKIWYSEDNDEYRIRIAFTAGVQVAYPDEAVRLDF